MERTEHPSGLERKIDKGTNPQGALPRVPAHSTCLSACVWVGNTNNSTAACEHEGKVADWQSAKYGAQIFQRFYHSHAKPTSQSM